MGFSTTEFNALFIFFFKSLQACLGVHVHAVCVCPCPLTHTGIKKPPVALPHSVFDLFDLFNVLVTAVSSHLDVPNVDVRILVGGDGQGHPRPPSSLLVNDGIVRPWMLTHSAAPCLRPVLVCTHDAAPSRSVQTVFIIIVYVRVRHRHVAARLRGTERAHPRPGAGIGADDQTAGSRVVSVHGVTLKHVQLLVDDGGARTLSSTHRALYSRGPVLVSAVLTGPLHRRFCHDYSVSHMRTHTLSHHLLVSIPTNTKLKKNTNTHE